jgi:hypothetical protein
MWNGKQKSQEGWVYFKCDDYITIETCVWEKDQENYEHCPLHRMDRVLVLCYNNQWNELTILNQVKSVYGDYGQKPSGYYIYCAL